MDILHKELVRRKAITVKEDEFTFFIVQEPEEFLDFCVMNKYLLHGSSSKIEGKLEPRRANDLSKEFGNQKGVYLTETPIVAMFVALTRSVESNIRQNSITSHRDDSGNLSYSKAYFAVSNPEAIQVHGFVYIFPKSVADDVEGSEFISKKAIKPEVIIRVKIDDFPYPIEIIE
jgi:hypothetical protein